MAGKTGTARKPQPNGGYEDEAGNYHYVATFGGFVPANDPQLSIVVVIDEPAGDVYGGDVSGAGVQPAGRQPSSGPTGSHRPASIAEAG